MIHILKSFYCLGKITTVCFWVRQSSAGQVTFKCNWVTGEECSTWNTSMFPKMRGQSTIKGASSPYYSTKRSIAKVEAKSNSYRKLVCVI